MKIYSEFVRFAGVKGSLFILLFLPISFLFAQSEHINYFNANVLGESVVLNFELRMASICSGVVIERRSENENFTSIGNISGVCGSEFQPESYFFSDEQPLKNSRSFYRLTLLGLGVSDELEVFVPDLSSNNYALAIEPNSQKLALFFANWTAEKVSIQFYTSEGQMVYLTESYDHFVILPEFNNNLVFVVFKIVAIQTKAVISGKIVII